MMKISVTNKQEEYKVAVETEVERHTAKLQRMLKHYAPDICQLHGAFDKHPRKPQFTFSLNLSLPSGVLHATGEAGDARTTIKQAFDELDAQLKKHKEKLRKDYEWKRKRPLAFPSAEEAPVTE
jgi:ribosomal subunit interface protein